MNRPGKQSYMPPAEHNVVRALVASSAAQALSKQNYTIANERNSRYGDDDTSFKLEGGLCWVSFVPQMQVQ